MNAERVHFEAPKERMGYASAGFAEAVKMPRAEIRGASLEGLITRRDQGIPETFEGTPHAIAP